MSIFSEKNCIKRDKYYEFKHHLSMKQSTVIPVLSEKKSIERGKNDVLKLQLKKKNSIERCKRNDSEHQFKVKQNAVLLSLSEKMKHQNKAPKN